MEDQQARSRRSKFIFSLLSLATFVEYFNAQFLFASMRGLEKSLGLSPERLSHFAMAEEFALVSFIPVWGVLSDIYELRYLLTIAVFVTGCLSIILSTVSSFGFMLLIRLFKGATVGSVTPSAQKYIVTRKDISIGLAFGIIHSTACIARLVCSVVVTNFSSTVFFGIYGWRICSFIFGSFCILVSPFLMLMPNINRRPRGLDADRNVPLMLRIKHFLGFLFTNVKETFMTKTSRILPILIFIGDGPFIAASFVTLYFQYMGLSDLKAGLSTGLLIIGSIFGGVLGGMCSDYCHAKSPRYGRLLFGAANMVIRIVTFALIFGVINIDNIQQLYPFLAALLMINGATYITLSCVDRAILADVVMPSCQSFAVAFNVAISGIGSSVTFTPLLGMLTERVYGYQPIQTDLRDAPKELIINNGIALRNSITIMSVGTTAMLLVLYLLLCKSFGKDAENIRERAILEKSLA